MVLRFKRPFENLGRPRLRDHLDALLTPHLMMNLGIAEVTKLMGSGLGGTKFDFMAIGTGSTAAVATQTTLVTEITTNGGARTGTAATLVTSAVANDTIRFISSWTFTGTFGVFELAVLNAASAGVMLLRQVFAAVLNVVSQDTLQLTVDVTSSDLSTADATTKLTNAGFVEGNKLIATDLTPANGPISHMQLGSGLTAPAATDTVLTTPITLNGLARMVATITNPTTTTANDTVQASATWAVTGTQAVREAGIFNTLTNATGDLWMHHVFAADLNLINTDSFTMIMKYVNSP